MQGLMHVAMHPVWTQDCWPSVTWDVTRAAPRPVWTGPYKSLFHLRFSLVLTFSFSSWTEKVIGCRKRSFGVKSIPSSCGCGCLLFVLCICGKFFCSVKINHRIAWIQLPRSARCLWNSRQFVLPIVRNKSALFSLPLRIQHKEKKNFFWLQLGQSFQSLFIYLFIYLFFILVQHWTWDNSNGIFSKNVQVHR